MDWNIALLYPSTRFQIPKNPGGTVYSAVNKDRKVVDSYVWMSSYSCYAWTSREGSESTLLVIFRAC
jgi:hypothetical protein